jgi:cytoskeleton protein RodZ
MTGVLLMSEMSSLPMQPQAGALLRQAREAAGLHIAALAVSLKVSVKKLEALESDRIDLLPDAVFARALAASVCRTLKVDATAILAGLPQAVQPKLNDAASGINAKFRTTPESTNNSIWEHLSKLPVIAILALVLGTLAIVFFPHPDSALVSAGTEVSSSTPSVEVELNTKRPGNPSLIENRVIEAKADAAILPALGAAALNVVNKPVPTASPGVQTQQPIVVFAAEQTPAVAVGSGLLVLKARGASWVEVVDAAAVVQLRKTLVSGENAVVSGRLPLRVVIGRADLIDVLIREKSFDVSNVSKDNVARFEVK